MFKWKFSSAMQLPASLSTATDLEPNIKRPTVILLTIIILSVKTFLQLTKIQPCTMVFTFIPCYLDFFLRNHSQIVRTLENVLIQLLVMSQLNKINSQLCMVSTVNMQYVLFINRLLTVNTVSVFMEKYVSRFKLIVFANTDG